MRRISRQAWATPKYSKRRTYHANSVNTPSPSQLKATIERTLRSRRSTNNSNMLRITCILRRTRAQLWCGPLNIGPSRGHPRPAHPIVLVALPFCGVDTIASKNLLCVFGLTDRFCLESLHCENFWLLRCFLIGSLKNCKTP